MIKVLQVLAALFVLSFVIFTLKPGLSGLIAACFVGTAFMLLFPKLRPFLLVLPGFAVLGTMLMFVMHPL